MARKLKQFLPRAPRYRISSEDDSKIFFRYAGSSKVIEAEIINISVTGLGFVTTKENLPEYGEIIKIEFTVPESGKMAWNGKVLRINEYRKNKWWAQTEEAEDNFVFVGLQFHDLPPGHLETIHQGLQKKIDLVLERKKEERIKAIFDFIGLNKWKLIIYSVLIVSMLYFFFFITQPTGSYDSERGAPWGQRFK